MNAGAGFLAVWLFGLSVLSVVTILRVILCGFFYVFVCVGGRVKGAEGGCRQQHHRHHHCFRLNRSPKLPFSESVLYFEEKAHKLLEKLCKTQFDGTKLIFREKKAYFC